MAESQVARAYTADEMRELFLDHIAGIVNYVAGENQKTCAEKLDLLVFSILNVINGTAMFMPAFELRPLPHPDDKAWNQEMGQNWWPTGVDIADGPEQLHSLWTKRGGGQR